MGAASELALSTALSTRVRAVLFDVDGTLYRQGPVRARMALELLLAPIALRSLGRARRAWRAIGAFRRAQEELRAAPPPSGDGDGKGDGEPLDLARLQRRRAAERAGLSEAEVEAVVDEWMGRRPLRHLRRFRRPGVLPFLDFLAARGIEAGVLSDYPAEAKLEAMGLAGRFAVALCTTGPGIGAFKPHPRGFLRACEALGLRPAEVLYVGDRPDVDGAGALAAGMPCAIISGRARAGSGGAFEIDTFERLRRELESRL